jgi:hypothetical protein
MRDFILEQLRERACVRGKQRTWISELTDEQLYELFLRLRNGEGAKSIARYAQQAWAVGPKSTTHSVSQGILKFKKRIAQLLITAPAERSLPSVPHDFSDGDPPEDLEDLMHIAQLQSERIRQMMAEERETGVRVSNLNREVQALTALSKAIVKAREWELSHTGVDPVKQRKEMRRKGRIQKNFESVMDDIGPEGRNRLMEFTDRFLEALEKHAVLIEADKNGEYHLVESNELPNEK